jgi:hypothetical protein
MRFHRRQKYELGELLGVNEADDWSVQCVRCGSEIGEEQCKRMTDDGTKKCYELLCNKCHSKTTVTFRRINK